ncbi:hypothetical protein DFP72DRAFT_928650 [Ephemerocybe angulata]|uniref:Uncharacterized protein n=1 Tax=Ephemerocybe angulata TaxID=980116 RepID=A0A8H6HCH0_9AGAR|nr:hypothetical protein DFP72DRAFT_928650 [Tulosesus angulatus]
MGADFRVLRASSRGILQDTIASTLLLLLLPPLPLYTRISPLPQLPLPPQCPPVAPHAKRHTHPQTRRTRTRGPQDTSQRPPLLHLLHPSRTHPRYTHLYASRTTWQKRHHSCSCTLLPPDADTPELGLGKKSGLRTGPWPRRLGRAGSERLPPRLRFRAPSRFSSRALPFPSFSEVWLVLSIDTSIASDEAAIQMEDEEGMRRGELG